MSLYSESLILMCFLCVTTTLTKNITLDVPDYALKGDKTLVQCYIEKRPYSNLVEFQLNGKTLDSLSLKNDGCFSATFAMDCRLDYCWCDKTGTKYRLYVSMNETGEVNITCAMPSETNDFIFLRKTEVIHVIDVAGPYVKLEEGYRLEIGKSLVISCSVKTKLSVRLEWDCISGEFGETTNTSKTVEIMLKLHMTSELLGKTCACRLLYKKLKKITTFVFNETKIDEGTKNSFSYDKFVLAITSLGVFVITVGAIDIILVFKERQIMNKSNEIVVPSRHGQSQYNDALAEAVGHVYSCPLDGYLESTNSNGYEEIQDILNENSRAPLNGSAPEEIDLAHPYLEVIP